VPLIAPDSVNEILERADLVELIRGRVNLVKRGNRWVGRCPFHDERTPSFSLIPPDNRRYYCHGCGATGDAVRWMMEKEGAASFPDAVEALAERFGLDVRYEQASPEEERRRKADQRRLELLERAAGFYAAYLWRADEAAPARAYLAERGFEGVAPTVGVRHDGKEQSQPACFAIWRTVFAVNSSLLFLAMDGCSGSATGGEARTTSCRLMTPALRKFNTGV